MIHDTYKKLDKRDERLKKSDFCHNYSQAVMNVELFLRFSKEIA